MRRVLKTTLAVAGISFIRASDPTALVVSRARRKPLLSAQNGIRNEKRARVWEFIGPIPQQYPLEQKLPKPLAACQPRW